MADAGTTTPSSGGGPLMERLLSRGWEFDFFSAIWLLERYCVSADRVAVGERGPVGDEAIRFRPHVSVGFPPTGTGNLTGAARTVASLFPLFWVIGLIAIPVYYVRVWLKSD